MVGMLSTIVPNQPACLHTPLALKQERGKETMGIRLRAPSSTTCLWHLQQCTAHKTSPTWRKGFLFTVGQAYAEPRPCGKLGVCDPSKGSLALRRQAYHLPRLTRNAAAKRIEQSFFSPFFLLAARLA
jgi:hypothetical protein